VEDSRRREILKQVEEIRKQIWERHHEETREQIDQLHEELYQRIKEITAADTGESLPQSKLRLDHVLMWVRARVQSSDRDQTSEAGRSKASPQCRQCDRLFLLFRNPSHRRRPVRLSKSRNRRATHRKHDE